MKLSFTRYSSDGLLRAEVEADVSVLRVVPVRITYALPKGIHGYFTT
jgi:hypothetical protein